MAHKQIANKCRREVKGEGKSLYSAKVEGVTLERNQRKVPDKSKQKVKTNALF